MQSLVLRMQHAYAINSQQGRCFCIDFIPLLSHFHAVISYVPHHTSQLDLQKTDKHGYRNAMHLTKHNPYMTCLDPTRPHMPCQPKPMPAHSVDGFEPVNWYHNSNCKDALPRDVNAARMHVVAKSKCCNIQSYCALYTSTILLNGIRRDLDQSTH